MRLLLGLALLLTLVRPVGAAPDPLEEQGRRFVLLATSLGHLYPAEIDAYWGPPALDRRKAGATPSLAALRRDTARLQADVARDAPSRCQARLAARLDQFAALLTVLQTPRALSFDAQAARIYGIAVPPPDDAALAKARATLARLLPGRGDIATRLAAWRARFTVPDYRRRAVFVRALQECRARTLAHWPLRAGETVEVIWTRDVPAAWHRYQGDGRSRLEINPDAVADPGAALDVACHEAYPGHHAQFLAMEAAAGPHGMAVEDTVVILRSADQMLREGAAQAGIGLAFTPAERATFLHDTLFPLAGLDPHQAATFARISAAADILAQATAPILRDYYDGRMASGDALARLVMDAGVASPESLMDFTRQMGPYALGYTAARRQIEDCLKQSRPGAERWAALRAMVVQLQVACR